MKLDHDIPKPASEGVDGGAPRGNVVPLVGTTLLVFIYFVLLIAFRYIDLLQEVQVAISQSELDSRKMRLVSEMMEVARERSRMTDDIIDITDPFERDQLNLQIEVLANQFAAVREQLVALPLDDFERHQLFEEHPRIISRILPAQRHAAELAIQGADQDVALARSIMSREVFPGQALLIASLGKMIAGQQARIATISGETLAQTHESERDSHVLIGLMTAIVLMMSVGLVWYLRRVQDALFASHRGLELSVRERTRELLDARDQLQRHVDIVDKYVITSKTDTEGVITYASTAFCRISQYESGELIGQPHRIVRHPEMSDAIYEDLWRTIKLGQTWRGELMNSKKDGSAYWVDVVIAPDFDADGELKGYVAVRQDITDKKRIEQLSVTDAMTGLHNRLKLDSSLTEELQRAQRYGHPLCLILFDIDNFKLVNDTFGHQAGDTVIVAVADTVRSNVRATDIAGRWGGEEFLVICPDTTLQGACDLAERIRKAITAQDFGEIGRKTCSFGVAMYHAGMNKDELLGHADTALYAAKREGRDRIAAA